VTRSKRGGGSKKVANSLVALSSAAVLGVYTAGFVRTRAAAQRFADADQRRAPIRAQATADPAALPTAAPSRPPASAAPSLPAAAPKPASSTVPGLQAPPAKAASVRARKTAEDSVPVIPKRAAAPAPNPQASPTETTAFTPAPAVVTLPPAAPEPAPAPATTPPATSPPAAAPAAAAPAAAHVVYKDGTYTGWGTSRHGDIQATVVIEGGRIASASISQCYTRYPCSWIVALPPQVAQRQSPEVDYVSGATQSTNAFYYGVVEALSKAK